MPNQHLYRSVVVKKSQVAGMITDILEACSENIPINDPDVYIMVRVKENIPNAEFNQHLNAVRITSFSFPDIEYKLASAKGNPPGSNTL